MTRRHIRSRAALLLVIAGLIAGACQPASDLPRETVPADGGEPPPPPPLPTATRDSARAPGDTAPQRAADSADAVPPPVVADTDSSRVVEPPAAPPQPQVPAPSADCRTNAPTGAAQQRLRVFFTCGERERPVERGVPPTRAVLRAALEQLLRGPTPEERAAGFTSFFAAATAGALNSVVVVDGIARIDFDDFSGAIPNASSSAGSAQLLAQLRATIFQYASIRAAEITFEGSCDRFWNWLQMGCTPLTR
jgi:hypothetical protein